ncbi:MAG: hypothetical protein ACPGOY_07060 [Rhodospirillaceae bacterium]
MARPADIKAGVQALLGPASQVCPRQKEMTRSRRALRDGIDRLVNDVQNVRIADPDELLDLYDGRWQDLAAAVNRRAYGREER